MKYYGDNGQNSTGVLITLTEPGGVCAAAAGAAAAMQQHFSALATAQYTVNKKKKKKKQSSLGLPRWSPTLVLTELDRA